MKCGVETGDLRQFGTTFEKCPYRGKVVRLMQRRQRDVTCKLCSNIRSYAHGSVKFGTPVNDPMADSEKIDFLRAAQPVTGDLDGARQIRNLVGTVGLVDQGLFIWSFSAQPRTAADSVDLTFDEALKLVCRATGQIGRASGRERVRIWRVTV